MSLLIFLFLSENSSYYLYHESTLAFKKMNQEDSSTQLEGSCGCFGLLEKKIKDEGMGIVAEGEIRIL